MEGGTSTARGGPCKASIHGTSFLGLSVRTDLHNKPRDSYSGTYRCGLRPGTGYPARRPPSFDTKTATTNEWFQVPCIGPQIEGFHFNFNNRLRQRLSAYCKNTNRRPDNYNNVITKQSCFVFYFYLFILHGATALLEQGLLIIEASLPHSRQTSLRTTPPDEGSFRRRDRYLTTHNIHKRQTSMPPAGLEPTTSACERPQTHALDRAATGIG